MPSQQEHGNVALRSISR